jgi:hypothetical protein
VNDFVRKQYVSIVSLPEETYKECSVSPQGVCRQVSELISEKLWRDTRVSLVVEVQGMHITYEVGV